MNIIENGEDMEVSQEQAERLLRSGFVYDSGEGYLHLADGVTFERVEQCIESKQTFGGK